MTKINYVYTDRFGEFDLFFDKDGKNLAAWSCNDAMYRDEYMAHLFRALGFEVVTKNDVGKWKQHVNKAMKDCFGLDEEEGW